MKREITISTWIKTFEAEARQPILRIELKTMINKETVKYCLHCGDLIRGRKDKKYCNDLCRNAYNNLQQANKSNTVRRINRLLLKNRRILESLFTPNKPVTRVSRQQLLLSGFCFDYYTHTRINAHETIFRYCYEFGLAELENDKLIVVRKANLMNDPKIHQQRLPGENADNGDSLM